MTQIASVSHRDQKKRRNKLRRHKQMKIMQTVWQTFAVSSMTAGLLWVAFQPIWVLKAPRQIIVSGNRFLKDKVIHSAITLSYPQSLWRIEPSEITKSLTKEPGIAQAVVSRRLFPPGLIVRVKERVPVAITKKPIIKKSTTKTSLSSEQNSFFGLLDANGNSIPVEKHTSLKPDFDLPNLSVIGYAQRYRSSWILLYEALSQTSIQVREVDFQNPANLVLRTELGSIFLGSPSNNLPEQIRTLSQMRQIKTQLNLEQIDYIDLRNPEKPLVQMNHKR